MRANVCAAAVASAFVMRPLCKSHRVVGPYHNGQPRLLLLPVRTRGNPTPSNSPPFFFLFANLYAA